MKQQKQTHNGSILIVDEKTSMQGPIHELLSRSNYLVETVGSKDDAKTLLKEKQFHVIILCLNTSASGTLTEIKNKAPFSEIIVLTSLQEVEFAVQCMRRGAFDILVYPAEDQKILFAVEKTLASMGPEQIEKIVEKNNCIISNKFHDLTAKSRQMRHIFSLVDKIANSSATVLIRGESGTGKRLIAHAIHKADSERGKGPFVEMSCGALPREIIESELFGHTKGAFTGAISDRRGRFEQADNGTILLDDIDTLSLDLQVKLLRVLQMKEFEKVGDHKTIKVDVRIIATTNNDLEKLVAEKKFREDLYYRLHVITLDVPPLRERREDIAGLVSGFLDTYSKKNHKKIKYICQEALDVFMCYDWPGNIRQLENIIERAVILDADGLITKEDLPKEIISKGITPIVAVGDQVLGTMDSLKNFLEQPEKVHILNILKEVGWNKNKAASKLGVNRTTLYNKLRKYNIVSV